MVAGVARTVISRECVDTKRFHHSWILSAKVMRAVIDPKDGAVHSSYDEEKLLETQILRALESFTGRYNNARVVNISFGDPALCISGEKQQSMHASFIDEMAHERDLMFVIAAGNNDIMDFPDKYPHYSAKMTGVQGKSGIIYICLTVGSITQDYISYEAEGSLVPRWGPSPFTRTGPGLNGMIKPELVETGGTIPYTVRTHYLMETAQTGIVVVNPRWMEEGTLLTTDYGTSLSGPKIANYLARLCKLRRSITRLAFPSKNRQLPGPVVQEISRTLFKYDQSALTRFCPHPR